MENCKKFGDMIQILRELSLQLPPDFLGKKIVFLRGSMDGRAPRVRFVKEGRSVIVRLGKLPTVNAGQELPIEVQF